MDKQHTALSKQGRPPVRQAGLIGAVGYFFVFVPVVFGILTGKLKTNTTLAFHTNQSAFLFALVFIVVISPIRLGSLLFWAFIALAVFGAYNAFKNNMVGLPLIGPIVENVPEKVMNTLRTFIGLFALLMFLFSIGYMLFILPLAFGN